MLPATRFYKSAVKYPKVLIHMADLHFDGTRSDEYQAVITTLLNTLEKMQHKDKMIIIIAGDLFEKKTSYDPNNLVDFRFLMMGLMRAVPSAPIIIIPGNHDGNLNCFEQMDLLTPVVDLMSSPNVHYLKHSGFYTIGGVKFYHLSVYDKRTRIGFAQFIQENPSVSECVLLYHGRINGARFGKTMVSDSRLTKDMIERFVCVCAGDIHEHQYVADNAAYSGSLIQRNIGEGLIKGYIMWDLEHTKSAFVQIHNEKGMIKLSFEGKTVEESLALIDAAPKPAQVTRVNIAGHSDNPLITEAVQKKFGKIDRAVDKTVISPSLDITTALRELLEKDGSLTKDQVGAILAEQEKISMDDVRGSRWTVTRMQWDNILRFGPGNVIDFGTLSGLSGIIAANEKGKTSTIDILVFALFGKYLRGKRENFIRHGAKQSFVRVEFQTQTDKYFVERRDDRNKNTFITFGHLKDDKWVNVTGKSVDIVYADLAKIVGTLDDFLATGLYYEGLNDLCKVGRSERMRILPMLFGMRNNDQAIKALKKKLTDKKAVLSKLTLPRAAESKSAALTAEALALESKSDKLSQDIEAFRARVAELDNLGRPVSVISDDLAEAQNLVAKLTAEHLAMDSRIIERVKYAEPISCSQQDIALAREVITIPSASINADIISIEAKLSIIPATSSRELGAKVAACTKELAAYRARITDAPALRPLGPPATTEDITKIDEAILACGPAGDWKFAEACLCCKHNRTFITGGADRAQLLEQRAALVANKRYHDEVVLRDALATKERELDDLHERFASAEIRDELVADLQALKAQLAKTRRIEEAKQRVALHDKFVAYTLCKKAEDARQEVLVATARMTALHTELDVARKNVDKMDELAMVRRFLNDRLADKSSTDIDIGRVRAELAAEKAEDAVRDKYNDEAPGLIARIASLKKHIEYLGSSGLRMIIIKKNIDILIARANALLKGATFTLDAECGDAAMDIIIKKDQLRQPVAMGSGYQRFAAALALRLALCSCLPYAADFVIIDEGFGCADATNVGALSSLFADVRDHYSFMFLVSHVEAMQHAIEMPLWIGDGADEHGAYSIIGTAGVPAPQAEPTTAAVKSRKGIEITCECGAKIVQSSLKSHQKTALHKKKMAKA
jgi:DNA repair exonuclease SbcCD nuclease subunit